MPAKAGIQDFKYLNKIKNGIPAFALYTMGCRAFAGMTALFASGDKVSRGGRGIPGFPDRN